MTVVWRLQPSAFGCVMLPRLNSRQFRTMCASGTDEDHAHPELRTSVGSSASSSRTPPSSRARDSPHFEEHQRYGVAARASIAGAAGCFRAARRLSRRSRWSASAPARLVRLMEEPSGSTVKWTIRRLGSRAAFRGHELDVRSTAASPSLNEWRSVTLFEPSGAMRTDLTRSAVPQVDRVTTALTRAASRQAPAESPRAGKQPPLKGW